MRAMLARRFPHSDAEDVAQEVLLKVALAPERFAERVRRIDDHAPYFVRMALNTYLMRLRSQRRRELRETTWSRTPFPTPGCDVDSHEAADALILAETAPLSDRQREYLWAVLGQHRSIEEIAVHTATSPRAVRAVLQRAAVILREHYESMVSL